MGEPELGNKNKYPPIRAEILSLGEGALITSIEDRPKYQIGRHCPGTIAHVKKPEWPRIEIPCDHYGQLLRRTFGLAMDNAHATLATGSQPEVIGHSRGKSMATNAAWVTLWRCGE